MIEASKIQIYVAINRLFGLPHSAAGIEPTTEKVKAVLEAPAPSNVSQLRSFLGLGNHYAKFLPQSSTLL